jgi:hypothetical protein
MACACPKAPPPSSTEPEDPRHPSARGLPGCARYGEPQPTGRVPLVLAEMSGLAASVLHPGVLWSHNDSGNAFQLFALEPSGTVLATFTLTGATPRDIEDVAVGPCAPGDRRSCVFLADIGDNFQRRAQVRLYRLQEPEELRDASLPVETLPFLYPDRPQDAESLLIHPRTGRLAVLTKTRGSLGEFYALDGLAPDTVARASRLGELRAPGGVDHHATAADLHPSGERLLVRTYTRVWEVRRPGATRLEDLLEGQVVEVPGPSQAQSEAIAWLPGGRGFLVGSEFAGQLLYRVDCR